MKKFKIRGLVLLSVLVVFLASCNKKRDVEVEGNTEGTRLASSLNFVSALSTEKSFTTLGSTDPFNTFSGFEVSLKPFSISEKEITNRQYVDYLNAKSLPASSSEKISSITYNASSGKHELVSGQEDYPVVSVNLNEANGFSAWASESLGKTIRIPRESEWEYASRLDSKKELRSVSDSLYAWGAGTPDISCDRSSLQGAVYIACGSKSEALKIEASGSNTAPKSLDESKLKASKVGSFSKSYGIGLYDMNGNVWELTCSQYSTSPNSTSDGCVSDSKSRIVIKGGSFRDDARTISNNSRGSLSYSDRLSRVGFRVVRED